MLRIVKFWQERVRGSVPWRPSVSPQTRLSLPVLLKVAMLASWAVPALAEATVATPLSKAEFDAIVVEADEIHGQQAHTMAFKRPNPVWHALDRDKLARLLQMPEFAALDNFSKEPLVDQAGAWDLMPFDSPADALAMWERWFPRLASKPVTPGTRDVREPYAYLADHRWAIEAGANAALMHCYPNAAWYVRHDEPMLWAMEYKAGWDHANVFDFGTCVRQQGEEGGVTWRGNPDTPRGQASAAVIARVLSRYLLAHGCTGEGPNRCLPMLHALGSLNPEHESLVPILKALEPDFALDREIVIPESIRGRREPGGTTMPPPLTDADLALARDVARQVMRKVFFLTAKIPVLLDRLKEWPVGEIERTVNLLVDLTVTLNRTHWLSDGRHLLDIDKNDGYFFAAPWHALAPKGVLPDAAEEALRKLGRDRAGAAGCRLADMQVKELPEAFWLAYAEAKLAAERTSCGALAAYTDAAKRYGYAVELNDPKLLHPIAAFGKFVAGGGDARRDVVAALAVKCPEGKAPRTDPWKVCRLAAQARAEEEAKRKAAEPPPPPPTCAAELPLQVAKRLGYLSRPQYAVCKLMPDTAEKSIVALSSLGLGLSETGEAESDMGESDMGSYDVDVLVVRADTGRVQSRLLLEKAYESDAWRYEGVVIDTALYRLAPGVRAFGLRAGHSGSSRVNPSGESKLSLFVEQGSRLRRVLADLVVSRSQGEWDTNCAGNFTATERTVAIASTHSNGFADLVVTSTTTENESKLVDGECRETARPPSVSQATLRFDARSYVMPNELR